jgi:hypothetical protein
VLANKIFRHRLISNDNIIALAASISYTFNVSIESRYDDRELKDLLIDHDAAIRSSEDIEQYTILRRLISNIELNKDDVSKFKFDIDNSFSIDLISLSTSIDRIKFHIVLVNTSFLLCLADLDRLDVYFNNLINMLIEDRYSIDLQIDMKNFQKAHVLHIDMKNDPQKANLFQIDLKKDHHSIIRRYDHAFLL